MLAVSAISVLERRLRFRFQTAVHVPRAAAADYVGLLDASGNDFSGLLFSLNFPPLRAGIHKLVVRFRAPENMQLGSEVAVGGATDARVKESFVLHTYYIVLLRM